MKAGPTQTIKFEDRGKISDIYLPITVNGTGGMQVNEAEYSDAFCFTGDPQAKALFDGTDRQLMDWVVSLFEKSWAATDTGKNFRLDHEGTLFRVHRADTVQGHMLAMRALPQETPRLADLHMQQSWRELLLDAGLLYGGLVLAVATNGQGKTTTISAALKSRLEKYSGFAVAIEDPPELPLHGWHGTGRCEQVPATTPPGTMYGSGYGQALVDARRYFPAVTGGGTSIMIGEIRNAETAAETILAANEGHLVLATFHGGSIPNAIMRLTSMAAEKIGETQSRELLSATLRLCIYQRLKLRAEGNLWERGEVSGNILSVPDGDSQVAKAIRLGDFQTINAAVGRQHERLMALHQSAGIGEIKNSLKANI
jgi:twitching motility protein PilT